MTMVKKDHIVPSSFSFGKDLVEQGKMRLSRFVAQTKSGGITEYNSPTYTGVDLECVEMLLAQTKGESVKRICRVIKELFLLESSANFLPFSECLGGTCSRTYNFPRNTGGTDTALWLGGLTTRRVRPLTLIHYRVIGQHPRFPEMTVPRVVRLGGHARRDANTCGHERDFSEYLCSNLQCDRRAVESGF